MANMPIKKFRAGNFEAAVWVNSAKKTDGQEFSYKTVSLNRSYKKKDEDVWRNEVINLRKSDIVKAQIVLNEALKELMLSSNKEEDSDE